MSSLDYTLFTIGRALESLGIVPVSMFAHYIEFKGGPLDGIKMFAIHSDLKDEYYHGRDIGAEKTAVDKYVFSGGVYQGDSMPDGRRTYYYPYSYVSTETFDHPLCTDKKKPWEI